MSTRATYSFETENGPQYIYIHHDGYPQGAAVKFYDMLVFPLQLQKSPNILGWATVDTVEAEGGYYFNFIRANGGARPTTDHESHGDAEYRYALNMTGHLVVMQRITESDDWSLIFSGRVVDFVKGQLAENPKYAEDNIKNYQPLIEVDLPIWNGTRRILTTTSLAAELATRYNDMAVQIAERSQHGKDNPNYSSFLRMSQFYTDAACIGLEKLQETA